MQYLIKESGKMKGYYKVPFRDVYCDTLRSYSAEIILCHVVYRLDPPSLPDLVKK